MERKTELRYEKETTKTIQKIRNSSNQKYDDQSASFKLSISIMQRAYSLACYRAKEDGGYFKPTTPFTLRSTQFSSFNYYQDSGECTLPASFFRRCYHSHKEMQILIS